MKPKNVDEYIKAAAPKARPHLKKIRRIIKSVAPKAEEKIGYEMPWYRYHGMFLAFGAHKNHVGFYALTTKLVRKYKKELGKYGTATSTIRFPFNKPLPQKLIKKMLKEKVKMNKGR